MFSAKSFNPSFISLMFVTLVKPSSFSDMIVSLDAMSDDVDVESRDDGNVHFSKSK